MAEQQQKQIQCMCGWWPPAMPQSQYGKREWGDVAAHQQAHVMDDERRRQKTSARTPDILAAGPGASLKP